MSVERIVDHIQYIVSVTGIDHVGLGSDFVQEVMADLTHRAVNPWTTKTPSSTSPAWKAPPECRCSLTRSSTAGSTTTPSARSSAAT
ncbi:membrane dipeptidase [Streptomyces sp. NPDC006692]|uniref:membrane dipeptidase n=1 Tax=Streptomyces sp. NPDC006692 TaxID=3364758 RepID=UPI00368C109B